MTQNEINIRNLKIDRFLLSLALGAFVAMGVNSLQFIQLSPETLLYANQVLAVIGVLAFVFCTGNGWRRAVGLIPYFADNEETQKERAERLETQSAQVAQDWADTLRQARASGRLNAPGSVVTHGLRPEDFIIFYVGHYRSFKLNFSSRQAHQGDHVVHYVTLNNELRLMTNEGFGVKNFTEGSDYPEGTEFIVLENDTSRSHMTQIKGVLRGKEETTIRRGTGPMLG